MAVVSVETTYAALGHFKRSAVRIAWFSFVFPSLVLQYLGYSKLFNSINFLKLVKELDYYNLISTS